MEEAVDQTSTEMWDIMVMLMQGYQEWAGRCDESSVDSTWSAWGVDITRQQKKRGEKVFFALVPPMPTGFSESPTIFP